MEIDDNLTFRDGISLSNFCAVIGTYPGLTGLSPDAKDCTSIAINTAAGLLGRNDSSSKGMKKRCKSYPFPWERLQFPHQISPITEGNGMEYFAHIAVESHTGFALVLRQPEFSGDLGHT